MPEDYNYEHNIQFLSKYQEELKSAQLNGDESKESRFLGKIGYIYLNKNELSKAEEFFNKSLEIAKKLDNKERICMIFIAKGQIFARQKNLDQSLELFKQALLIAEELNNIKLQSSIYWNCATISSFRSNLDETIKLLTKSLTLAEKVNEVRLIIGALTGLINANLFLEKYDITLSYCKKLLEIEQKEIPTEIILDVFSKMEFLYSKKGDEASSKLYRQKINKIQEELGIKSNHTCEHEHHDHH